MIDRFVLVGATGDLAGRYVLPALAALHADRRLPASFRVTAAARPPMTDEQYRQKARSDLATHASDDPEASRSALLDAMRYQQVDVLDPASIDALVQTTLDGDATAPITVYLALPTSLFEPTIRALCATGLPLGSRVVVEKPFGTDLETAVALNMLLGELANRTGKHTAFRVDHFLGLAPVHNLLGMRLGNRFLEAVWNREQIEQVEIVWEETLGLEGRAAYYDRAGQFRDMIQNHLLQVLCLFAMDLPAAFDQQQLRDRKVEVLRAVRPPDTSAMATRTCRARYTAGRIGTRELPSYVNEDGVDPHRDTETFAEVAFSIDNDRWRGTPFVVRTGKALGRSRMEVVARFRPPARGVLGDGGVANAPTKLRLGLAGDGALSFELAGATAGTPPGPATLELTGVAPRSVRGPYYRVLLDILTGSSQLSVRGDEAEEAWRVVAPVLQAWDDGLVPMREYPAGSAGPDRASVATPRQTNR